MGARHHCDRCWVIHPIHKEPRATVTTSRAAVIVDQRLHLGHALADFPQRVLSEAELLWAMFDFGYFPPNTPRPAAKKVSSRDFEILC